MATNPVQIDLHDVMDNTRITAIVFDRAGHQIRTPVTGSKKHETFVYPSSRYRRAHTGETSTELLVTMISEVLPCRLDFSPSPMRIEAEVYGKPATAFPDYAYVDIGGRPVLGEAKRSWDLFGRPSAILQQAITRKAAEELDWSYEQATATSLGSADFLANVEEIQAHRFVTVPIRAQQATVRALEEEGPLQVAEIISAMKEHPGRGLAYLSSMMVRRVVAIDLECPLTDRSIVRLAPKRPFAFPSIRL